MGSEESKPYSTRNKKNVDKNGKIITEDKKKDEEHNRNKIISNGNNMNDINLNNMNAFAHSKYKEIKINDIIETLISNFLLPENIKQLSKENNGNNPIEACIISKKIIEKYNEIFYFKDFKDFFKSNQFKDDNKLLSELMKSKRKIY